MTESSFRTVIVLIGLSQLGLAAWMIVAPGTFFDAIAGFGGENDHYVRDVAAIYLAIGAGMIAAASRPSWRFPILAISAVWYLAHAVNHLVDIGDADPGWVGPADFVALLLTGLVLLWLAVVAQRSELEADDRRA